MEGTNWFGQDIQNGICNDLGVNIDDMATLR